MTSGAQGANAECVQPVAGLIARVRRQICEREIPAGEMPSTAPCCSRGRTRKVIDMAKTTADRAKLLAISALVLSATALRLATPASADQSDDAFLAALKKHGVVFANREAAVATGHRMCAELDAGQTPTNLALSLARDTDLSVHEAGYVLGVSVASYCPQYRTPDAAGS